MVFCPKCGAILKPKIDKKKNLLICSCGYKSEKEEGVIVKKFSKGKDIEVIPTEEENIYPLTENICPECKHTKAYFWTQQTRGADEPETRFFKCEKCKHVWREYT